MKEIVFINRNRERWLNFDQALNSSVHDRPDQLADLFIQLTDDLSYARTYYPGSDITRYLNDLTLRAHLLIYKNQKEKKSRFTNFWVREYPLHIQSIRKYIFFSALIFFISVAIGVVSALYDDSFVRLILGDSYVNMTLQNIGNGDPLAVYKQANQLDMFLGITLNNIFVSFLAFVYGLIISVGTGYIMFTNGVMVGSFLTFFYQHGLLGEAMLTIWIHGTLEIFAIIVAGAAGLLIGNSIIFPGTYSRRTSFINGAKTGLKALVGLIPVFIIAGFLEGFVTRYTDMPVPVRLGIILFSVIFIVGYFFIYPEYLVKRGK